MEKLQAQNSKLVPHEHHHGKEVPHEHQGDAHLPVPRGHQRQASIGGEGMQVIT